MIFATLIGLTFSLPACIEKTELNEMSESTREEVVNPLRSFLQFMKGMILMLDEQYGKAIKCADKSIEVNPVYAPSYYLRGTCFYSTGRYDEALIDYNKAIELDDTFDTAYYSRGLLYQEVDDFDNAFADYSSAIKLDPDYEEYYFVRGKLYLDNPKKFGREGLSIAKEDFIKACELGNSEACEITRDMAEEEERYGDSIKYYTEAIRSDPNKPVLYLGRGNSYYATGRYKEAIEDFTKAIERDKTLNEAYYWRGRCNQHFDNPEKALADYNEAIRLDPNKADYYSSRARVYLYYEKVHNRDKANEDYLKACELGDSDACSSVRFMSLGENEE
jgi:tetratricopeptide (TPR) repeat protein